MTGSFVIGSSWYFGAPSSDQGIFKYGGSSWSTVQASTPGTDILHIARNPSGLIVADSDDSSVAFYSSTDGGASWAAGGSNPVAEFMPFGLDESGVIWAPNRSVSSALAVAKTADFGATWSLGYAPVQPSAIEIDCAWASDSHVTWPERLIGPGQEYLSRDGSSLAGPFSNGGAQLIRSTYGGTNQWVWINDDIWQATVTGLYKWDGASISFVTRPAGWATPVNQNIYSVIPFDDNLVFVAANGGTFGQSLWKSSDSGSTWTRVIHDTRFMADTVGYGSQVIDQNPLNPAEMVAVATGGVFHSIDTGDTWTFIAGPSTTIQFACVAFTGVAPVNTGFVFGVAF